MGGGYFSIVSLLISFLFVSCSGGTDYVGGSSGGSGDYKITISTDTKTGGTVTADKEKAAEGDTVTLTVTPESGYELDTLTVKDAGGSAVTVTANSFTMPKSNVTVSASFKAALVTYSVTVGTMTNGTVTASKTSSIAKGVTVTLTVTPDAGYELDTLSVKDAGGNDVTVTANAFTMPESDVTISATFKMALVTYSVTIGTIAHASSVTANPMTGISAGSTVTITITPEANYKVETITVKQGSTDVPTNAGTAGTYTFTMPSSDVTVNATLVPLYAINIPTTSNGTVTAKVGGVEVTQAVSGETVTLTISPNTNCKLDALSVKDASNADVSTTAVTAGTSYTFTMPGSDVTVNATIVPLYTITVPATTHGTVTAEVGGVEATQAASGETVTLTVTPATGAKLVSLSVRDAGNNAVSTTAVTPGETYTFTMPSSNTTIGAGWEAVTKDSITAVGDVVLSTGKYIATENTAHMSDAQKAAAVAVIFDAAGRKGVGLVQGTSKAWAINTANGYGKNITTIAVSKTGGSNASDATFSDESSGSGNWDKLKNFLADGANGTSDDTGTAGNYPAWEWVNAYSTYATNLGTTYASGWYMPSIKELCDLYKTKDTVNTSISNTGGTQMSTSWYWSSSQLAFFIDTSAWDVDFGSGGLYTNSKDRTRSFCAVRAF